MTWVIHRNATEALFVIAVIGVSLLRRHRPATEDALEPLPFLGVLTAAQGLVGTIDYELTLPADIGWVHVTRATLRWLSLRRAAADVGVLVPRTPSLPALEPAPRLPRSPRPGIPEPTPQ